MALYNFTQFNEKHKGEDYIFVWNDGKERPYSFESYYMIWNGSSHEVYEEACGSNEREALYELNERLFFRIKKLNEYKLKCEEAFVFCNDKSLLVN